VDRNGLILGVSAVLFGITALMLVVGVVVNPFFLFVAIPFAGSAYLLWYQASGKLNDRIKREAAAGNLGADRGAARDVGFDAGPFGGGGSRRRRRGRRTRQRTGDRRRGAATPNQSTLSPGEARQILDVDAAATEDDLKTAYRRKAKESHPDTDSGDEEQFKKVSRAYETLSE